MAFEEVLEKDDFVSIDNGNLKTLGVEMYKVVNGGSPQIMKRVFSILEENGYNLRYQNIFKTSYGRFSLQRHRNNFVFGA